MEIKLLTWNEAEHDQRKAKIVCSAKNGKNYKPKIQNFPIKIHVPLYRSAPFNVYDMWDEKRTKTVNLFVHIAVQPIKNIYSVEK